MPQKPLNDEEPSRIARPGLGGGQPRQSLHVPSGSTPSGTPSQSTSERYPRPQRVVVKAHVVRHRSSQKGRESITRHVRYLGREAVTRDAGSGRFFDAKRDELDAKAETRSWAQDRHHFRIIVSPENAHSIGDLTAYTRELMTRIEQDLGAIQWLAVNHSNTDNPHVHLLIRGRTPEGADLVIPRQYVSHGIRQRAAEVATDWLGERTREEAQIAVEREVRAERWTTLDGALARFAKPVADSLQIDLKEVNPSRFTLVTRQLLTERLGFLKEAGLAQTLPPEKRRFLGKQPVWRLAPDFQKQLNELGARQDIIKNLYASLGQSAAPIAPQVQRILSGTDLTAASRSAIRGVVIAKGPLNELSDERFVVLEDRAGKPHYVHLWASDALDAVQVGGVLEVGRSAHRRWRIAREIIRVAEFAEDWLYSTGRHRKWLETQRPRPSETHMEMRLRGFFSDAVRLAQQADSGVAKAPEAAFTVDRAKLEQFTAARNRWLDLRVLAAHSLDEQVQAHAYTWLDRQMLRTRLTQEVSATDIIHNPKVQSSLTRRADWLVQQGYAKREVPNQPGAVTLLPGTMARLIAHEHQQFAQHGNQTHGKSVDYLREGHAVAGIYRGTAYQHRGAFALIQTEAGIVAAPVSREPWAEKGQRVIAKAIASKFARIDLDRSGGRPKSLGIER